MLVNLVDMLAAKTSDKQLTLATSFKKSLQIVSASSNNACASSSWNRFCFVSIPTLSRQKRASQIQYKFFFLIRCFIFVSFSLFGCAHEQHIPLGYEEIFQEAPKHRPERWWGGWYQPAFQGRHGKCSFFQGDVCQWAASSQRGEKRRR